MLFRSYWRDVNGQEYKPQEVPETVAQTILSIAESRQKVDENGYVQSFVAPGETWARAQSVLRAAVGFAVPSFSAVPTTCHEFAKQGALGAGDTCGPSRGKVSDSDYNTLLTGYGKDSFGCPAGQSCEAIGADFKCVESTGGGSMYPAGYGG